MKTLSWKRNLHGVALVIVLSFIVLLTFVIVAYFSRTILTLQISKSSSSNVKAENLAKGALQAIIGELRNEMAAGSVNPAGPEYTVNGKTIYQPSSNKTVVPQRTGTSDTLPNLVKKSTYGESSFAGTDYNTTAYPPALVPSIVPTTAPSRNGTFVPANVWNKPSLSDPTAMDAFLANSPPNWILMSRSGPTAKTDIKLLSDKSPSNPNYVVGRFAYMIYDEGSLLDVNVAGYPNNLPADEAGKKGPLALADLSVIAADMPPEARDALLGRLADLINWRNAATGDSASTYLQHILDPNTTFLTTAPGDQTFLSRQDLLAFFEGYIRNFPDEAARVLPYLGTFSREKNAPSWSPAKNADELSPGGDPSYAYRTDANEKGSVNRNLANVRYEGATDSTITSYLIDLTTRTRPIKRGDPLVQNRFPLDRLSWLEKKQNNPADTSFDAAIKAHFGLILGSQHEWTYTSPEGGSAPAGEIKTLDQVASLPNAREPDFFELLKAGILKGSLGKTAGDPGNAFLDTCASMADIDYSRDQQVIQIGANIIDQYDSDCYPSGIRFKYNGLDPWVSNGIEHLPYMYRIFGNIYRRDDPTNRKYAPDLEFFYQVDVWDPHRDAKVNYTTALPNRFRIVPSGKVSARMHGFKCQNKINWPPSSFATGVDYLSPIEHDVPTRTLSAGDSIAFNRMADINYPVMLANRAINGMATAPGPGMVSDAEFDQNFVGIYLNKATLPDARPYPWTYVNVTTADKIWTQGEIIPDPIEPVTLELQYELPGAGGWRTFQTVRDIRGILKITERQNKFQTRWKGVSGTHRDYAYPFYFMYKSDPRVERFGVSAMLNPELPNKTPLIQWGISEPNFARRDGGGYNTSGGRIRDYSFNPTPDPIRPFSFPVENGGPGDPAYGSFGSQGWTHSAAPFGRAAGRSYFPQTLSENDARALTRYSDPDGIRRVGDNGYPWSDEEMDSKYLLNSMYNYTSGPTSGHVKAKPVLLNRPFRSVGELGYVNRGMPWKSLDFSNTNSADAGLLDIFCIKDSDVNAGRVSLHTPHAVILEATLKGTLLCEGYSFVSDPNFGEAEKFLSATDPAAANAESIAEQIVDWARNNGPLSNRSELSTQVLPKQIIPAEIAAGRNDMREKTIRESVARSLGECGNTRTWNLMIDIIAQTGQYGPKATLSQFTVEGERRYWLHLAIDRYSGEIVDTQMELVHE